MICVRSLDEVCPRGQDSRGNGVEKSLWPEHGTALLLWSLSVKHVIVHQSVSVGCRPLTRQRGHARSQAQRLYQCPQNVLCMTDDICAGVDVGEKTWCYFQVQWHSLGRHKVSVVLKSSVPTLCEFWHLGQQRSSSTSSLAVSSH